MEKQNQVDDDEELVNESGVYGEREYLREGEMTAGRSLLGLGDCVTNRTITLHFALLTTKGMTKDSNMFNKEVNLQPRGLGPLSEIRRNGQDTQDCLSRGRRANQSCFANAGIHDGDWGQK